MGSVSCQCGVDVGSMWGWCRVHIREDQYHVDMRVINRRFHAVCGDESSGAERVLDNMRSMCDQCRANVG